MEALKALMVARRHQRNEAGVEDALETLGELAPPEQRDEILLQTRGMLLKVGPPIQPQGVGESEDSVVGARKQKVKKRRQEILQWFCALSCGIMAIACGIWMQKGRISSHPVAS